MCWFMNAEELITIAHKRLCSQASKETRELVEMICKEVIKVNPEFKELLVPLCVYRGGICEEFHPCGRNKTYTVNAIDDENQAVVSFVNGKEIRVYTKEEIPV